MTKQALVLPYLVLIVAKRPLVLAESVLIMTVQALVLGYLVLIIAKQPLVLAYLVLIIEKQTVIYSLGGPYGPKLMSASLREGRACRVREVLSCVGVYVKVG